MLSGLVRVPKVDDLTNEDLFNSDGQLVIATLPKECIPVGGRAAFILNHNDQAVRVDVLFNGQVVFVGGDNTFPWVSLDGIMYCVAKAPTVLNPINGWRNQLESYRLAGINKHENLCLLSGTITARPNPNADKDEDKEDGVTAVRSQAHDAMLRIPGDCQPRQRIVLAAMHANKTVRLDLLPEGRLLWTSEKDGSDMLSLDGLHYFVNPPPSESKGDDSWGRDPRALAAEEHKHSLRIKRLSKMVPASHRLFLQGNWVGQVSDWSEGDTHAHRHLAPAYTMWGKLCMLSGLIQNDDINQAITTLPHECRPHADLSYLRAVNERGSLMVLGVRQHGRLAWQAGSRDGSDTLSLDGVAFPTENARRRSFKLLNDWSELGRGSRFATPSFHQQGDVCWLFGQITNHKVTDTASFETVAEFGELPALCRPKNGTVLLSAPNGHSTHLIEITVKGKMKVISVPQLKDGVRITLDGLSFYIGNKGKDLQLSAGYTPSEEFAAPALVRVGAFCMLSGVVDGQSGLEIAELPASSKCRPLGGRKVFHVIKDETISMIEVRENGKITWTSFAHQRMVSAGSSKIRVSLDSIRYINDPVYVESENKRLALEKAMYRSMPASRGVTMNEGYMTPDLDDTPDTPLGIHYTRVGPMCFFSGLSHVTDDKPDDVLFRIPRECRPSATSVYSAFRRGAVTTRLDVLFNGDVMSRPTLSLSNVRDRDLTSAQLIPQDQVVADGMAFVTAEYAIRHSRRITLNPGWLYATEPERRSGSREQMERVQRGYSVASFTVVGKLCMLSGVITSESFPRQIARLPITCRPKLRLSFSLSQGDKAHVIDITSTGMLEWITGPKDAGHRWISLDGLVIYTGASAKAVDLATGWTAEQSTPAFVKQGSLCILMGSARTTKAGLTEIGTVPQACRPYAGVLSFAVNKDGATQRVQLGTNGKLIWRSSDAKPGIISLDGIRFVVDAAFAESQRALMSRKAGILKRMLDKSLALQPSSRLLKLGDNWFHANKKFTITHSSVLGDLCTVSGVVVHEDELKSGSVIGTILDARCQPAKRSVFTVAMGTKGEGKNAAEVVGAARVEVTRKGEIIFVSAHPSLLPKRGEPHSEHWLSLDGIIIPLGSAYYGLVAPGSKQNTPAHEREVLFMRRVSERSIGKTLRLARPWKVYDRDDYNSPWLLRQGEMCVLSGFIRVDFVRDLQPNTLITSLPKECLPRGGDLTFVVGSGEYLHTVQIDRIGRVIWLSGPREHPYITLDGVAFLVGHTLPSTSLPFAGTWRASTVQSLRAPSYTRHGAVCVLSGAVTGSEFKGKPSTIANMPLECRSPLGQASIFAADIDGTLRRLSLKPNGALALSASQSADRTSSLIISSVRLTIDPKFAAEYLAYLKAEDLSLIHI